MRSISTGIDMEQNYVTVTLCRCLLFRITVGVVRVTVWVKCRVMLSWSLRKNEETRLDAFEKRSKKILWVSWTTKKTNEWVFNKPE